MLSKEENDRLTSIYDSLLQLVVPVNVVEISV